MKKTQTVEAYIENYPPKIQAILKKIRTTLKSVAPKAEESISYGIPALKLNGKPLIYFAGFKDHVSVYPTSDKMVSAIKKVADFRTGRGTAQFALDKAIPYDLIKKMAQFRLKELKASLKK